MLHLSYGFGSILLIPKGSLLTMANQPNSYAYETLQVGKTSQKSLSIPLINTCLCFLSAVKSKILCCLFFSLFLLQISWVSDCILALPCYNSVIEFQKVQIKYKENFFPDLSSLVSTFDTVISESYSEIQLSSLNSVYRLT